MKLLIAMAVFMGLATSALADDGVPVRMVTTKVNSTLGFGVGYSGRIYYECNSLERNVEDFLEEMGATNINIRCHGGLDTIGGITTYASISGSFDSYVYDPSSRETREMTEMRLRGHDNCALIAELMDIFQDSFVIEGLRGNGSRMSPSCTSSRPYNIKMSIVR